MLYHTIGKMSISYVYLAQPAYLTSVYLKQTLHVCLLKTKFQLYHGHDKRPSTAVALELSSLWDITHVHITHLTVPITRLSVHETDHNVYYIVSRNCFYKFLKISQPIILLHRNGVIPIRTPVTFEVGFLQSFKLRYILHTDYLARVVAFQNGYMIPLSRI